MKRRKSLLLVVAVGLLMTAFVANACLAQQEAPSQAPAKQTETMQKTVIKGKIAFGGSMGYYIQGVDPGHEFMITNQNPALLKKLMKSKKVLTIEGHYDMGADRLFVEKIDGKPYKAAAAKKKS